MKKLIKTAASLVLVFIATIFLVPILLNVHNEYLRILSNRTVLITNKDHNSGATGFIIKGKSGQKYVMTNNHVCNLAGDDKTLLATYHGEEFEIEVYKRFLWNDLCAMKAHRPLGTAFPTARNVTEGEEIYVIGHPLLEPTTVSPGELTSSIFIQILMGMNTPVEACSGPTYRLVPTEDGSLYQALGINTFCVRTLEANPSTATTQPGNSGSPVVNIYGSVVGVDFAGNNAGRAYFVPLQDLKDFLEEL